MNQKIFESLYKSYSEYKQPGLDTRRIKHCDVEKIISNLRNNSRFVVETLGQSIEGRNIYQIKIGSGETKVLLWSQMHGDESTATRALFDIFNLFSVKNEFADFTNTILKKLTLYFIPMLNPDGAERYQRWNAINMDLNRDALRLQSPESKILKSAHEKIAPDFGFNLHDQDARYSAGKNFKSAAISFLAPPYNYSREVNDVRKKTMQVMSQISETMSLFIPGHIGRFNDEYEPRAFGDNFVKCGTSSILIESGGWKGDPEKNFIRQLNFTAILSGLFSIAASSYENIDTNIYNSIPENEKFLFSIILRNLKLIKNNKEYITDIGITLSEKNSEDSNQFFCEGIIEEIGDLSTAYAYDEYDFAGMEIIPGKIYPDIVESIEEISKIDFIKLYREGYTSIMCSKIPAETNYSKFPINIIRNKKYFHEIKPDREANFVVVKNHEVRYIVINGFLFDLTGKKNPILNGLIIS